MSHTAEYCKKCGNDAYNTGNLVKAIEWYTKAVELSPATAVYTSNLSAAEFEDGRYAEAVQSCNKAIELINDSDPSSAVLRAKLLARRARALLFLAHGDASRFQEAFSAHKTTPSALVDTPEAALNRLKSKDEKLSNARIMAVPRYRRPLGHQLEYYVTGHDDANSIFRTQYDMNSDDGAPNNERFHVSVPRDGSSFDFSALFCGIGDARHLYASLIDIGQDLEKLDSPTAPKPPASKNKAKKSVDGPKAGSSTHANSSPSPSNMAVHFTAIDIHPAALARDLIVLSALDELSHLASPTLRRAKDLLTMLHYLYWGTVMPPLARRIMDEVLDRVHAQLRAAQDPSKALDLGWLYVEPATGKAILEKMEWWQGEGKTAVPFRSMVGSHKDSRPTSQLVGSQAGQELDIMKAERKKQLLEQIAQWRTDPVQLKQMESEAEQLGITLDEYLTKFEQMDDDDVSGIENVPLVAALEHKAIDDLKVLVPPPDCGEPEALEEVFASLRSGNVEEFPYAEELKDAFKTLSKRWLINYTMLDKDWLFERDQFFDPFAGSQSLIPSDQEELFEFPKTGRMRIPQGCLYNISERFFWLTAMGMKRLGSALRIEVILGDGFAVMDAIRFKTLTRHSDFPVLFDRIHASNVSDYVGGYLADFTTAMPMLKDHEAAYFTRCCLLNSGIWEGGMASRQFGLNMDSQLFTYAAITHSELGSAFGVELSCTPGYPGNYHTYGRAKDDRKRLSRERLTAIATGCLVRAVLPTRNKDMTCPQIQVREVVNVHSFFRALETFKDIGYSSHILADLVESILEDRLKTSPRPHDITPIPLAERALAPIALRTAPFLSEFEVAAALWEPRLFPICSSALPAISDLKRYSIKIKRAPVLLPRGWPETMVQLALVFGLPADLDAPVLDPRKKLVGTYWRSSLELSSTFDYDPRTKTVSFILARSRAQNFVERGYEAALVNTAFWRVHSRKVSCAHMREVGDVDRWDTAVALPEEEGRPLTEEQFSGFEGEMMGGAMRNAMGAGGMGSAFADMLAQGGGPPGGCPTQ